MNCTEKGEDREYQVVRGFRALRSAEQGSPGDRLRSRQNPKGGGAMVKTVLSHTGLTTALVVFGWLSFLVGLLNEQPLVSIPLLAVARVLP